MPDLIQRIQETELKIYRDAEQKFLSAKRTLDSRWRWWIRVQTPASVWDEYRANGYTIREAIDEEVGNA